MTQPKTFVERLDAARTGEEFAQVLNSLFDAVKPEESDDAV